MFDIRDPTFKREIRSEIPECIAIIESTCSCYFMRSR